MATFSAPLEDIGFVLTRVLAEQFEPAIAGTDNPPSDVIFAVLTEAARQVESIVAPLHQAGESGCPVVNGQVRTPPGFAEAFRKFCQGGWQGLSQKAEYGGAGFPFFVAKAVDEMISAASLSFSMYPGLTAGCLEALDASASDEQRATYCPKLATGEWTGTMCITESGAGTDIGSIRTRAVAQDDGSHQLFGSKIFISSGDHDLASNIVHFVLARESGAPAGVKGLSTFVVPKFLLRSDGQPGKRNAVYCSSTEHKMGLRGSATCTMNFEGAKGWLVGASGAGTRNMFVMMNLARIFVGFQGLGLCELATQNAIRYAKERVQGTTANSPQAIIEHPDVRRMIFHMKAITEGIRVLAYETAIAVEEARNAPTPQRREAAQDQVELNTPILKAFATDSAVELASMVIQVFGGHGYIQEHGIEQILRDSKITCLYEGTNGVQAQDLVRRKLQLHGGRLPRRFFAKVVGDLERCEGTHPRLETSLRAALASLVRATNELVAADSPRSGFASTSYLRAFALTYLGLNWLRTVAAIDPADVRPRAELKRLTALYFATHLLVQVPKLCDAAYVDAKPFMALDSEAFA